MLRPYLEKLDADEFDVDMDPEGFSAHLLTLSPPARVDRVIGEALASCRFPFRLGWLDRGFYHLELLV